MAQVDLAQVEISPSRIAPKSNIVCANIVQAANTHHNQKPHNATAPARNQQRVSSGVVIHPWKTSFRGGCVTPRLRCGEYHENCSARRFLRKHPVRFGPKWTRSQLTAKTSCADLAGFGHVDVQICFSARDEQNCCWVRNAWKNPKEHCKLLLTCLLSNVAFRSARIATTRYLLKRGKSMAPAHRTTRQECGDQPNCALVPSSVCLCTSLEQLLHQQHENTNTRPPKMESHRVVSHSK